MVRTNIGVKWREVEPNPLTGTIAYEVQAKRDIPGPAEYDPPRLEGPHGGKFNASKSLRVIEQILSHAREIPGPGQYNGGYDAVVVALPALAGYMPIVQRGGTMNAPRRWHSPDRLQLSPSVMSPAVGTRQSLPMLPGASPDRRSTNRRGARSVEPQEMSNGRRSLVSFSSPTLGQQEQVDLAALIREGLANANGNFTGGHNAVAGSAGVRHQIITPVVKRKEKPIGGNTRRYSIMTTMSLTSTVAGPASLAPLPGASQPDLDAWNDMQQDIHGLAPTRDNTPANPWYHVGLSRTVDTEREMSVSVRVSCLDASISGAQRIRGEETAQIFPMHKS